MDGPGDEWSQPLDPTTDGPTRQSDDRQRTHLDSEARRALATATSLLPLGPKLAYLLLWERAGSQPEHIIVRPRDLANEMGLADAKSARDYLEHLGRLGLVDIVDRHRRRGTISLYVYRPADIDDRTARPDPQRRLPLKPARARGDLSGQIPGGLSGDLSEQSPATAEDTLYTRASRVEDEVDVDDESTVDGIESDSLDPSVARRQTLVCPDNSLERAAEEVTDVEAVNARESLEQIKRKWKRVGLEMTEQRSQRETDESIIRRSHVLMERGVIPEWLFAEAVNRPIGHRQQGKPVSKPAAQFTKIVFEVPWFGKVLGAVKEPLPPEKPRDSRLAAETPSDSPAPTYSVSEREELREMYRKAGLPLPRIREPADAGTDP